ncbi:bifunctional hydroxymethylpyrimidine kinase/phosphomethylpyrimidine kinase [Basilea psittacipulmonis]|uniref:hydroxymethylpyrimidine kinase n=1 Tax=Basilea psittacipulmonis DSM 24701 TaxID=1072685 RepID=A0A077DHI0_9BURK|nr:bifunctional hydroxymethylpyrimidine kinase/phosphomethylpyrimidine kinase [Basilea psittacipulmonis]AIL33017.1 phosphomethylpyrimidine kinase [Basilea psittacipulmonis DSM 24701]
MNSSTIKNVLSIAGLDPSGGAGILADVKTISALGSYACAVITALTAQNTQAVTAVENVSPRFVAQEIDTLFADVTIHATKIGMLSEIPLIETVADRLIHWKAEKIVLDPVMVAKSGDHLLARNAIGALKEMLLPQSLIITPNLPEAAVLLNISVAENRKEMWRTAEQLHRLLNDSRPSWVLLKGGHAVGNEMVDMLYNGDKLYEYETQRINTKNTHGTGCTYSSAIATLLAQEYDVPDAVEHAHRWLHQAIIEADKLSVGHGHGSTHHFHAWWQTGRKNI